MPRTADIVCRDRTQMPETGVKGEACMELSRSKIKYLLIIHHLCQEKGGRAQSISPSSWVWRVRRYTGC